MVFKLNFIFIFLFLTVSVFAYEWLPHGPQGVKITNICFVSNGTGVLCSETGIYLYQDDMEWHFYESGLPVIEAEYFTSEKLLLIMGDGTYADGIYTFDLQTEEFELVEWLNKPAFIRYYEYMDVFYAGQLEGGLYISQDGLMWYAIGLFEDYACYDIAFYEEHIAVSDGDWLQNQIYLSDDAGSTWYQSINAGYLTCLEFNAYGSLFGVFPGMTHSAGLRQSDDYGYYWEPLNWEFFITSLACDPFGYVLVGWDNGYGVARVDPSIWDPPFVHIEEGLPDTHVYAVKINPVMSAPNVFVCTDSGAFYSHDYLTDVIEIPDQADLQIIPNPVHAGQNASLHVPEEALRKTIQIFDAAGNCLLEWKCTGRKADLPTRGMQAGIYYIRIQDGSRKQFGKLLVL
jgi:hypothetical protein